ncbi:MAG TPA: hypothetical protein VFU49_17530, partial [Ktedonobacteraceae bacterium]|nr:hypothetical protein [Ktedonobacteraceae bacterium]
MADAEKKKTIEQLWYTWSDVGLSTVYAGARIRAASEGLSDIYSERVQSIDRYTRYTLPPGTDRYAITPQQAPVCLAYLRTSWDELILVHKQYIGLDGVGRPGNFFTHLFALGRDMDEISPAEAIWLWNSPIWKTSDAGLDRRSVKLEAVSLDDIEHAQTFSPTYIQVQQYLPFLIEAYLSRRASSPIYLAAPANASDMIANLIAGLAWCLPRQLLANLTFSTYEPDWSKATTQIVGVSWVPGAAKEQRPESGFTPQFYQEQLALNCATGECSHLERHPLALYSPLTAEFARFATDCLVYDEMEELNNLIEQAEQDPQLNLEMFLRLYSNLVVDKQHLRPGDIEEYLSSPSYRLARLADHTFREQIIDQAVQNQLWWQQRLKPILLTLRQQSERERSSHRGMEKQPLLAAPKQKKASSKEPRRRSNKRKAAADSSNALSLEQVLSQLARNAVPTIISTMKQLARSGMRSAADNIEEGVSVGAITTLLELMDSVLASDDPYGIWKSLCESILANADACRFLTEHWEIHSYLLQKWGKLLPAEKNEAQLQSALVIFWSHLGEFLALRLHQQHPQWVVLALQELLREKSGLTPLIVQQLEQQYAADVQSLLEAFIKDSNCWSIAVSFVITLSEKRYAGGQPYAALVESLLSGLISSSQWHLLAKDLVVAWTIAGYSGSDGYLRQVEQL